MNNTLSTSLYFPVCVDEIRRATEVSAKPPNDNKATALLSRVFKFLYRLSRRCAFAFTEVSLSSLSEMRSSGFLPIRLE
jgi:hypothetical protein